MTDPFATEVRELLSKNPRTLVARFWETADEILELQDPIVKVLKNC